MDKTVAIRIIIILIGIGAAVAAAIGYNYFGADLSALPVEQTVVERVYHKTEYNTRRVGKTTVRTNPHEVYYLQLRRLDGSQKDVKVKYEVYLTASKGDTALLPIGPGKLGWEISNPQRLTIPHPRKPNSRRHCRFVGTSGEKISADSILNEIRKR